MDCLTYCQQMAREARAGFKQIVSIAAERIDRWLLATAEALETTHQRAILEANARDLAAPPAAELSPAQLDRLRLTPQRLGSAASGLREIAALPCPAGRVLDGSVRPNGMSVQKVAVPLGVIFFLYESRPNVTLDAAALCVKSRNAVILRGGKEALETNQALASLLRDGLARFGLPASAVQLIHTPDRAAVGHLLQMADQIDLVIPRGGESLIRRVAAEATMPVLKHYQGICHVYVDRSADLAMAQRIIVDAKCQRPGVCNAAECLLVHQDVAAAFLPPALSSLKQRGVEIRGCARTRSIVSDIHLANDADYATEYLDLILSVKVVDSLDEAIDHIGRFGSHHTDSIVTNDLLAATRFTTEVDSACVLINASTRLNDGQQLGLGAEIGISTDKFHARGPCGLLELCSYKYVVAGNGHLRE